MMLQNKHSARLQVVTPVTEYYWDMAQDGLVEMYRCCGETFCFRIQVRLLEAFVNLYHTHGVTYHKMVTFNIRIQPETIK